MSAMAISRTSVRGLPERTSSSSSMARTSMAGPTGASRGAGRRSAGLGTGSGYHNRNRWKVEVVLPWSAEAGRVGKERGLRTPGRTGPERRGRSGQTDRGEPTPQGRANLETPRPRGDVVPCRKVETARALRNPGRTRPDGPSRRTPCSLDVEPTEGPRKGTRREPDAGKAAQATGGPSGFVPQGSRRSGPKPGEPSGLRTRSRVDRGDRSRMVRASRDSMHGKAR
jgi:hypothetical protein